MKEDMFINNRYTINETVFKTIDSEDKAYWMGFIWEDGYLCIRNRNETQTYEFKLSTVEKDINHLLKFKKFLNYTGNIHSYKFNGYKKMNTEKRISIYKKQFGKILYYQYDFKPNRTNCKKLLNCIPEKYYKDFIRGILDADGCIVKSLTHSKIRNTEYIEYKYAINFCGTLEIINFIQNYFLSINLIQYKSKIYKRHQEMDGNCVSIKYYGNIQVQRILSFLYKNANTYLDRKYQKYLEII